MKTKSNQNNVNLFTTGKKYFLAITALAFITGASLTSCSTPAEKVENAESNVETANTELNKANEDYLADVEKYKKETAERTASNDKIIADLNLRSENEKNDIKEEYKKKIAALEEKNREMKKKMDEYKAESKDNWEEFKAEFNRDMDELGQAFEDLTVKNNK